MKISPWKSLSLSLFFTLSASASAAGIPDRLDIQSGNRDWTLKLSELKEKIPTVVVDIKDDAVYSTPKKYDAFRLNDLLKLLPNAPDADEIVFQAADGYAPVISRTKLESHEAYLAYQEHGRSASKGRFEEIHQGKAWISPAPFYLVWRDGKTLGEEYPWPYQLVKIEFVSFKEKYRNILPETARGSAEMRGFQVFKTDCLRCHSLNLVGGDIGPELNTPKSVLEYWDKTTLRAFIKKVSSFRARDKMPDFPNLKENDIDDLLSYFNYLKDHRPAN